jgi:superfamily I DNA and/or RNA helicase
LTVCGAVDRYQGEENNIIVVSLTRIDEEENSEFTSSPGG